jgi:hypothetical protein
MSAATQTLSRLVLLAALAAISLPCSAQSKPDCPGLPNAAQLRTSVQSVVRQGSEKNGGLGNQEWAAVVNRDGIVCAIVFSGTTRGDQWPGSRLIAAEKANTANGLSGNNYALSTANIFAASQPGQSLYSLATSAPPNPNAVFGNPTTFGTPDIRWSAKPSGGLLSSAEVYPSIRRRGKLSAVWA